MSYFTGVVSRRKSYFKDSTVFSETIFFYVPNFGLFKFSCFVCLQCIWGVIDKAEATFKFVLRKFFGMHGILDFYRELLFLLCNACDLFLISVAACLITES